MSMLKQARELHMSAGRVALVLIGSFIAGAGASWAYTYAGMKWSGTSVTYYVSSSLSASWVTAIKNSEAAWDGAGSKFRFSYGGTKSFCDGTSQVFSSNAGNNGAPATTSVSSAGGTTSLIYTNINTYYSFSIGGSATTHDLQNIMTHEFGHWLTLADSYTSSSATMYYSAAKNETKKRTLETDDKDGIKYIYGI